MKSKEKYSFKKKIVLFPIQFVILKESNVLYYFQKSEFEPKQFSDYKDQFQWFIAIGILFLIIDIFLFDKKTKWEIQQIMGSLNRHQLEIWPIQYPMHDGRFATLEEVINHYSEGLKASSNYGSTRFYLITRKT